MRKGGKPPVHRALAAFLFGPPPVADQAALRGILTWIWDANLTVLSVTTGDVP
jgi:hypothetical protein